MNELTKFFVFSDKSSLANAYYKNIIGVTNSSTHPY